MHDPTTLNAQGYDKGTQYRSIILYSTPEQKTVATQTIAQVSKQGKYHGSPAKITTQLKQLDEFYPAEEHHQNYYNKNSNNQQCKMVIKPKLGKLTQLFEQYVEKNHL